MATLKKIATLSTILFALWGTAQPVAYTAQTTYKGIKINAAVDGYLGVPYAEPPIGQLRFAPPQPVRRNQSRSVVRASAFGPVCHQFHYKTVFGGNLLETSGQSEDCLTLNIFVPRRRYGKKLLPVFVWSYGGAFGEGGGSVPLFNPTGFVENNKDIIVVTWNYRLSIFGFPAAPNRPANLGLRDQRAALEWLQDNIRAFGGDAARIVLGGQSAGADSIAAMMYTHANDPIAAGLILQSGIPEYIGESDGREWRRLTAAVGCRPDDLDCMRRVPAETLHHAVSNETFNRFGDPSGGGPIVDNVTHFSVQEYLRRGERGEFARVPTLMGITDNEGNGAVNWDPFHGVNQSLSETLTTTFFNCPMAREASFRVKQGVPTWRYRYKGVFPSVTPYPWLGAYHSADIPFILGSPVRRPDGSIATLLPYEVAARRYLQSSFAAFIRDPVRGLEVDMGWPRYNETGKALIELFAGNSTNASFVDATTYDAPCANPPPICWECYVS
ncbi:hypothetical protein MFIFM68171_04906 [Madurella fahalii]|uniref:Carboxylic ester hydrolase n=1 Tax=Madurella fahalii TaxID=1157608 RepID=A0ABQ0GAE3_9PEZI